MIAHPVIEYERIKRGLTVKEAAEKVGMTPARWLAIAERGKGTASDIHALSELFDGVSADYLLGLRDKQGRRLQ